VNAPEALDPAHGYFFRQFQSAFKKRKEASGLKRLPFFGTSDY
jgi:hypothetical protein